MNINNPNDIVKLLYDVDTSIVQKQEAFIVFEHLLRSLPGMEQILTFCREHMKTLKITTEEPWKEIARRLQSEEIQRLKRQIKHIQQEIFKRETNISCLKLSIGNHDGAILDGNLRTPISEATLALKRATRTAKKASEAADASPSDMALVAARETALAYKKLVEENYKNAMELKNFEFEAYTQQQELTRVETNMRNGVFSKEEKENAEAAVPVIEGSPVKWQTIWGQVLYALVCGALRIGVTDNAFARWKGVCYERMNNAAGIQSTIARAEALLAEKRLAVWGGPFLLRDCDLSQLENKMEYRAWIIFKRTNPERWVHSRASEDRAIGILQNAIDEMRWDKAEMGITYGEETKVVATVKKSTDRLVEKSVVSGRYEESTEKRRPIEEPEEAPQKAKKGRQDSDDDADGSRALVVVPRMGTQEWMDQMAAMIERTVEAKMPRPQSFVHRERRENIQGGRPRNQQHNGNNSNSNSSNNYNRNSTSSNSSNYRNNNNNRNNNRPNGTGNDCVFHPCIDPGCKLTHKAGQHVPDARAMEKKRKMAYDKKCQRQHDDEGSCTSCRRAHGFSKKTGTQCNALTVGGICQSFYSREGCPFNHMKS